MLLFLLFNIIISLLRVELYIVICIRNLLLLVFIWVEILNYINFFL